MSQLSLPVDDEASGELALKPLRPERLGVVERVDYVESGQLLKPAEGFIGAYKFTLNPYSGCGFSCDYCYARFFAPSMEQQAEWGRWVTVKENAVALVRRAVRSKSERSGLRAGDTIYMSSVTDPYQPIEAKLRLSRAILAELLPLQPRLTIQTRSPLVTQDIDLIRQFDHVRVSLSIPTDDEGMRLRYEPHAPSIGARLRTARQLRANGIAVGIAMAPMLPMKDAGAFGREIGELGAAEYVCQFMHATRGRFSAGTPNEARQRFAEDGWTVEGYRAARDTIAGAIAPRPLLEGSDGFQPPP